MNAKVNYNTDSASLVTSRLSLERGQNDLIFFLGGNLTDFVVSTEVLLDEDLDYEYLHDHSMALVRLPLPGQHGYGASQPRVTAPGPRRDAIPALYPGTQVRPSRACR